MREKKKRRRKAGVKEKTQQGKSDREGLKR